LIYFDARALLKFVKREKESEALRAWRAELAADVELATSELAGLEITRTLLRAGVDRQRVPYVAGQALRGVYLVDVTSTVLARARAYGILGWARWNPCTWPRPNPFLTELTDFVTYDDELAAAAVELGFPACAPT
jgi:uncharacterized protein